jgi:outer membrane murein-binding lipoprotein Lpp
MRMRAARVLISWLVGGLIIGFLIWYLPPKFFPRYTAQTFIRVLPGTYSASVTALIKNQSTLVAIVDTDKIQQTEWFQKSGTTKGERIAAAVANLHKHLYADVRPDSDLIMVSMTCGDEKEAAAVLNGAVDSFLQIQQSAKKRQIAADLMTLERQQERLQRDMDTSERTIDDIRHRFGIYDLEEHNWPHPITQRLMRLEAELDNCALEIKQLQARLDYLLSRPPVSPSGKNDPNLDSETQKIQAEIKLSQIKLTELEKMREEVLQKQENLDVGRAQLTRQQAFRDERRQALDSMKSRIETLQIAYDDPDSCGILRVEDAVVPQWADSGPWQIIIPATLIAAAVAGIVHLLLSKRA